MLNDNILTRLLRIFWSRRPHKMLRVQEDSSWKDIEYSLKWREMNA
jgi:hypothetical protein